MIVYQYHLTKYYILLSNVLKINNNSRFLYYSVITWLLLSLFLITFASEINILISKKGILLTGTCSNSGKISPKTCNKISRVLYAGSLIA